MDKQEDVGGPTDWIVHDHAEDVAVGHAEPVETICCVHTAGRIQKYLQVSFVMPKSAVDVADSVSGTTYYGVAFSEHIQADKRAKCYGLHLDFLVDGIKALPETMPTFRLQPLQVTRHTVLGRSGGAPVPSDVCTQRLHLIRWQW